MAETSTSKTTGHDLHRAGDLVLPLLRGVRLVQAVTRTESSLGRFLIVQTNVKASNKVAATPTAAARCLSI